MRHVESSSAWIEAAGRIIALQQPPINEMQAITPAESVESRQAISNSLGHVGLTGDFPQEIEIIGNGERIQRDGL